MSDFEAKIEHPDGPALGWASGPTIRFYDGSERPVKECKADDLVWLLDLPYAKVAEAVERSFSRYVINLGTDKERDDTTYFVDAAIWAGLRNDTWALKALEWAKVHHLGATAAIALRDFVDRSGNEEAAAVLAAWREAAKTVGKMDQADLKQFVLDLLGGRIYTSAHMSDAEQQFNLQMVFMPLAMGALSVPEAVLPRVEPLPPSPQEPSKAPHPDKPERGTVEEPAYQEVDAEKVAELEFRERWDRAPKGSAEAYKTEVEQANTALRAKFNAEVAALDAKHDEAMREWAAECRALDVAHKEAVAVWEADMEAWREEHADLIAEHEARDEIERTWFMEYASQIGIFWEYLDKAGPRSINGMPMFFSVRIMHRDDWQRAAAAHDRERQRMDDLEV